MVSTGNIWSMDPSKLMPNIWDTSWSFILPSKNLKKKARPVGRKTASTVFSQKKEDHSHTSREKPRTPPNPYTVPVTRENGRFTHMGDQRLGLGPTVLWTWGRRGCFFYTKTKIQALIGWQVQPVPNHRAIAQFEPSKKSHVFDIERGYGQEL